MRFTSVRPALPKRAAFIAASVLALCVSLAIASSAAAINLPVGSPSDTTVNQSLYGALNDAENVLVESAGQLSSVGDTAVSDVTSPSDLTTTNADQIDSDYDNGDAGGVPASGYYVQDLINDVYGGNQGAYELQSANTDSALATFILARQLITLAGYDPTDYPNGLFTIDGDLAVSSTATVTKANAPAALTVTYAATPAAAGGYVLPKGFAIDFPSSFHFTSVKPTELTPSQESDPPSGGSIGTVTIDSPTVKELGLSPTKTLSGKIYMVSTTPVPSLELSFGAGNYVLGVFPTGIVPLTVTFGEPILGGSSVPLPLSSLELSFPASTSVFDAASCTKLGSVAGTATDVAATLASEYFGDGNDGAGGGNSYPVTLTASATKVTDDCPAATPAGGAAFTGAKTKNGVAQLKVQKTYTITDHSGTKPLYLGFAKAPKVPSGKGTAFKGVGAGNWAITVTVTDEMLKDHTVDFAYKVKSKVYVLKAKISS